MSRERQDELITVKDAIKNASELAWYVDADFKELAATLARHHENDGDILGLCARGILAEINKENN